MRNITETGVGARLNLGCGEDVRAGYLNIDLRQTHPNVIIADLSKYPWPFADRSAKEIMMLDFLEHFPYANTAFILLECYRVLEDGGELIIQVPDAEHLMKALACKGEYLCNQCGDDMFQFGVNQSVCSCGQGAGDIAEAAMRRLYGGQDYPGNFHYTCFTQGSLMVKAAYAGFQWDEELEPEHQYKNWNFKTRFRKGSIW